MNKEIKKCTEQDIINALKQLEALKKTLLNLLKK